MGVRIISDAENETAVMYCSNSMWAFGPVFVGRDAGERLFRFELWYSTRYGSVRLATDRELSDRCAEWADEESKADQIRCTDDTGRCLDCGADVGDADDPHLTGCAVEAGTFRGMVQ